MSVFSAILAPVSGGELALTQQTETTLVILEINANPLCTVALTEEESLDVAHVLIGIVDDGLTGKQIALQNGGNLRLVRSSAMDGVRITTMSLAACSLTLASSEDEVEKVIGYFSEAGA